MTPAVAAQWERCKHLILPVLEDLTEGELLAKLAVGHMQLWPDERSAMVTALVVAEERQLVLWLGAGVMDEILGMIPGIACWGRAQGAEGMWVFGRKGWKRALAKLGFVEADGGLRKGLS